VVTKENFLKIYREAHLKVLTPDLIKAAFCKVGIVPFNRNVITPKMMAPSCNTSYKVFTPVVPLTPVQIISDLLIDAIQPTTESWPGESSTMIFSPSHPLRIVLPQLASTEAGYLTSQSPIKSMSQLPDIPTIHISPVKHHAKASGMATKTSHEQKLQEGVTTKQAEADFWKRKVLQLQAMMVLQWLYCGCIHWQLRAKEIKDLKKGQKGVKSPGRDRESHLKVMTDDEFFKQVKVHQEAVEAVEAEGKTQK